MRTLAKQNHMLSEREHFNVWGAAKEMSISRLDRSKSCSSIRAKAKLNFVSTSKI